MPSVIQEKRVSVLDSDSFFFVSIFGITLHCNKKLLLVLLLSSLVLYIWAYIGAYIGAYIWAYMMSLQQVNK